jgi:hypothetical protein
MLNIGLEQQQRIWGSDGTILWSGAQVVATSYQILVAAGGTTIKQGDAVQWDATNTVIPRPETTAQGSNPSADLPMSLALYGNISPGSISAINVFGVAQEPIAANKRGVVAGRGSIVCVKCKNNATHAVGALVSSSDFAPGTVAAIAAVSTTNVILGAILKTNTTGATGTNSVDWLGIMIQGGAHGGT